MPLLVLGGLGSPYLITGGLAAATAPPPSSGGSGGSVVTRGLGRGALVIRGLGAATGGTPATPSIILTGYPGYFTGFLTGFRTAYYPGSSGGFGVGTAVVVLPGTFIAAVRATLKADAVLMGMLRGGVWKDKAPPGVRYPFIVYTEGSADPSFSTMDGDGNIPYIEHKSFNLNVYATVAAAGESIARRVVAILDDANIVSDEGVTLEVRHEQGYQVIRSPESAYGGALLWQAVIPYEAMLQKLYAAK